MSSQSAYDAACKRALLARERVESLEDIHTLEYCEAYIEFSRLNSEVQVWEEARYCYITDYNRYMEILRRKMDVMKAFEPRSAKYKHMYYSYIDIYTKIMTIRDEYHRIFGIWLAAPAAGLNPPENN
jgi:hypothetical protein